MKPSCRLLVTPGEPAGIGGEVLLKAVSDGVGGLTTLDDPERLRTMAKNMRIAVEIQAVSAPNEAEALPPSTLAVLPIKWPEDPMPGNPSTANAPMVVEAISRAASMVRDGQAPALVTNPIQKSTLYDSGFDCPGHTEFLARIDAGESGREPPQPVMMLHSKALRVVPLTIHVPLSEVAGLITEDRLERVSLVVDEALRRDFGLKNPRIAVAGLNPHAGEDGSMGSEERNVIQPVVEKLQRLGMQVSGPYPADTLFHADRRKEYDAAIAMYHDQALVPAKTLDFHGGVNTTLGLSFIRTSPDHGTALDLAGKFTAKPDSLVEAIRLARNMASKRQASHG